MLPLLKWEAQFLKGLNTSPKKNTRKNTAQYGVGSPTIMIWSEKNENNAELFHIIFAL